MKMTPLSKLIIALLVIGGGFFTVRHFVSNGTIKPRSILKSIAPPKADEISAHVMANTANVKESGLPSNIVIDPCVDGNTRNCIPGDIQEMEQWTGQANGSLDFSVGDGRFQDKQNPKVHGIQTSKGSLMEKNGVV